MANNAQQWAELELDNSMTNLDMITDNTEPDYAITKLDTLNRAKEDKLARLGSTTENKLQQQQQQTDLSGLDTYEKLTAYLQNKNVDGVNYDDAATMQEVFGMAMTYGLQKDDEGKEGFIDPSTGVFSQYRGDTRGAYIGETENGQMKFGLRRGDKTYDDRYTSSLFSSYGWDSGPEGVKPEEREAHMDQNLPAVLATALEKYIHSNAGQLAERTIGQGPVTPEWDRRLGSGKTEYTNKNAPLWNMDYDVAGVKLQSDTPLPGESRARIPGTWDAEGNYTPGVQESSRLANFAKGVPSTLGKAAVGVADSALEFVGKGLGDTIRLVDEDSNFADFVEDILDLGVKENRDKVIDSVTGYDSKYSADAQLQLKALTAKIQDRENVEPNVVTKILTNVAEASKNVPFLNQLTETIAGVSSIIDVAEGGEVLEYVNTALSTPEVALESAGDILVMAVARGKGITARNKEIGALRKDIDADLKANKGVDVEKAAQLKDLQAQRTMLDKGAAVLSENVGVIAVSSAYVNDAADEFKAMYNRDMTYTEKLGSLLVTVPFMMMDKTVALGNIKGVQEVAAQFKKLEGAVPSQMLVQAAYKSAKAATTLGVAAVKEFLQEVPQTIQQEMLKYDMINEDFTINELSEENKAKLLNESVVAGALAFGAGAHMATPAVTVGALSPMVGMSKDKIQEVLNKNGKNKEDVDVSASAETKNYAVSEDEKELAAADLRDIDSRTYDTNSVITSSDISRLSEIEDLMNSISTTPKENKKVINDIITSAREKYKAQVVNGSLDDVILKSREDIMELMSDVYTTEDVDTTEIDNKLYTLASKAGIVKDRAEFDTIKKDYYAVESEAVDGKRGYITLGKELKQLMDATTPNSKKIQAKIDKLGTFRASQAAYIKKAMEMVAEARRMVSDYNSSIGSKIQLPEPKQFAGKVPKTGTLIRMNFEKNSDGTFKVNMRGLDKILEAKARTIKGINNTLKSSASRLAGLGISEDTRTEDSIVVNTEGVVPKLKKALADVESKIKKNNINKIITIGEIHRNDYTKAIVGLNSNSVNLDSYEESDNVLITIPPEMKEKDIKIELAKGGSLYELLESVRKAGATVHIDAGKNTADNKVIRAVRRALTKYGEADNRYSPLEYGSLTLKPIKVAEEFRKNKKENINKTKANKEAKNEAEDEALVRRLDGESAKEIWNSSELLKTYYKDTENSTGIDKLARKIEAKLSLAVEALYEAKVNLDIATRSKKDAATIAILKDELEAIESNSHPEVTKRANAEITQRSTLRGVINEIRAIKEEKLIPEDEDSRIQALLEEVESTNTVDVLTQPESGETFKTNGVNIPIKIDKFVKVNDTSSILQIVPVDILFDDTLGINKNSLEYIADVVKFIKDTQVLSDKNIVSEKTNINRRDAELHDSPAIALVLDADGNVNQQVAMAMKLSLGEYISFNMNMLDSEYKAKDDVAQMIGVLEGQVGPATYRLLKDKGVFNKTAAVKVGTAFMDKMGLGFKRADGVEKELYNKLVADIGNMTLLYAKKEGILEGDEISVQAFGDARQSDTGAYIDYSGQGEGAIIHTVRMPKRAEDGSLDSKVKETTDDYNVIHEAISENSSFERRPSRKPIKVEKSRHIVEKVAKDIIGLEIPNAKKEGLKSPKEFIESLVKIKWKVDTSALDRLFMLDDAVIKKYLEYATEEELSNMTFDGRASAISKNREIDKSIEELKKLQTDIDNNNDMAYDLYFDWFYSSNGRYMMESNTLNPQTDKLHRFIVQPASHRTTYSVKDGKIFTDGKDVTLEMDYALAQAFGYAVDKESTGSIRKIAQEIKDLGYSEIKPLVEAGKEIALPSKTLKIEHLTHALQALEVLESLGLDNGNTTFTSSITAEYDAVTSGFGLKLMQFPILKDVWTWLNKVGVFQKGQTKHNSMNDILSEVDFYDSYQELAKNVKVKKDSLAAADAKARGLWEAMFELLPQSVGDVVSKELRTLFKDPFMTFNYSAGIKSIKASLANKLSTGILEGIVKGDTKYDSVAQQLATYTDMSVSELVEALKTKPTDSIKITGKATFISVGAGKKNKRFNIKDALDAIMEETYGAQVEEIMTTKFGRFIDINNMVNSSFRAMFDAFKVKYDEEKAKYAVGEFTEDAFNNVMVKLQNEFPLIKGPLSSGIEDGVGIYDLGSQNVSDDTARYRPAQTKTGSKESGKRTLKVRHAIKDFEAAISAGSVVPIHYIDGALMAQMSGVTAIHDAIMPKLSKSLESIKAYNKAMFDVNKQYNFLEEVLNMLNRVDVTGNKTETQIKVKNADGEWEYETMAVAKAFEVLRKSVGETVTEINAKKSEVYSKIARIGHMAGIPGSMWTTSDENEAVSKLEEDIIQKEDTVLIDETKVTEVVDQIASRLSILEKEIGALVPMSEESKSALDDLTEEQFKKLVNDMKDCL